MAAKPSEDEGKDRQVHQDAEGVHTLPPLESRRKSRLILASKSCRESRDATRVSVIGEWSVPEGDPVPAVISGGPPVPVSAGGELRIAAVP